MQIEIINELNIPLSGRQADLLKEIITYTVKTEAGSEAFEVSLTITNNQQIRQLNKEYRNIDRETDVLSFPLLDFDGYTEQEQSYTDEENIDPETGNVLLGDIVLSYEKAVAQADEYGHSVERELCYLCVHSVLHLLGYDHLKEEDKALMRAREEEILKAYELQR